MMYELMNLEHAALIEEEDMLAVSLTLESDAAGAIKLGDLASAGGVVGRERGDSLAPLPVLSPPISPPSVLSPTKSARRMSMPANVSEELITGSLYCFG